jgi:hypothetical protein
MSPALQVLIWVAAYLFGFAVGRSARWAVHSSRLRRENWMLSEALARIAAYHSDRLLREPYTELEVAVASARDELAKQAREALGRIGT